MPVSLRPVVEGLPGHGDSAPEGRPGGKACCRPGSRCRQSRTVQRKSPGWGGECRTPSSLPERERKLSRWSQSGFLAWATVLSVQGRESTTRLGRRTRSYHGTPTGRPKAIFSSGDVQAGKLSGVEPETVDTVVWTR